MEERLQTGLEQFGLNPKPGLYQAYINYVNLLCKWNNTHNLTAITRPEEIISRHILDSLSVLTFIKGRRCLDIGTGAGLPGLILALARPDTDWVLLDSKQKKIRFLQHVKNKLGLSNVELIHKRSEEYKPLQQFDTIICRAFAPLVRLLALTEHLLSNENQLLAMKGKRAREEISVVKDAGFSIKCNDLQLPGSQSTATLLEIRKR